MVMATIVASGQAPLLSYEEAAQVLGIKRDSVKQLVMRGHLHSVPAPEDRRRRRLRRSEVEAYARAHAGKWSYADTAALSSDQRTDEPPPALSRELVIAGAASVGVIALLIGAFRAESDPTARAAIIVAVIALGLLLLVEWDRQGKIDAAERRRLERLAKQAETQPERFLDELERLLPAS